MIDSGRSVSSKFVRRVYQIHPDQDAALQEIAAETRESLSTVLRTLLRDALELRRKSQLSERAS